MVPTVEHTSVRTDSARLPIERVVFTRRSLSPLPAIWVNRADERKRRTYTVAGEWYTTFKACDTLGRMAPVWCRLKAANANDEALIRESRHVSNCLSLV